GCIRFCPRTSERPIVSMKRKAGKRSGKPQGVPVFLRISSLSSLGSFVRKRFWPHNDMTSSSDAAQPLDARGIVFDYSTSIAFCDLHNAGGVTLGAQLMISRQERAINTRNRISHSVVHARPVLFVDEQCCALERSADNPRSLAKAGVKCSNAFN